MHNVKRRAMGSLMAVLMGTTTILGSTPYYVSASGNTGSVAAQVETAVEDGQDTKQVDASNSYGLVSAKEGNILHAWDWKFTDVTKSIKDIAEAGYSLVQVSPCQVCEAATTNNDWWKLYQPYDYKFGNSLGTEDEFKAMCTAAKEYGITIVVDVVANHMAGTGTGDCGTRKSEVDSWWTDEKFHNTGVKFTGTYDNNRDMMVRSNIGMPDIDTSRSDVQQRMVSYLESMLDMGAGGFRYDAAKHIGTTSDTDTAKDTFWQTISKAVSAKKSDALVYGEILNGMPVTDEYYVTDGIKVTESQKGWDMKDAVQKGLAASVGTDKPTSKDVAFTYVRKASASNLITWVENHDTYLNHWGSTGLQGHSNYMSDAQVMLAWSTVGARADAQALYFARPDGCSNPDNPDDNDASNKIEGVLGMSTKNFDWKNQKVASVNKFKNAMVGEGETLSANGDVAIIQRGNKGVVVTNFGSSSANFEVSGLSGLKDGTYEDASGQNGSFTVSGGKVSGSVKAASFVVLYDANAATEPSTAPTPTADVTETPAPAKAAEISVSSTKDTFEEAFEETITVKNAEYAYYSYDGGEWTQIKNGKLTINVGENASESGDEVALYVKAMGKDGKLADFTKTYTYQPWVSDTKTKGLKIRAKKSLFTKVDGVPYAYVYSNSSPVTVYAESGKWPGEQMTEEGDYYVYVNEDVNDEVRVIFNDGKQNGGWQDPVADTAGYDVKGYMEYDGTGVTAVSEGAPATVSPNAKKAGEAPEFTRPDVTETPEPATPTPDVPAENKITVSKENGTSFTSETLEVEINVGEGVNGTYSVDNGPVKSFTGKAAAVLGQGKIADTDVTLTITTDNKTETFTYRKVFDKEVAAKEQASGVVSKQSAAFKIQSLFEVVADAAEVNAEAETAAYYATNPEGCVGQEKTITGMSDFTQEMLVARSGAWDVPNTWNGAHENSVADCYGLYAAWDDNNLYVGMEFVNTTDTWANGGDGPLLDGGKMSNVPVALAINVGNKTPLTGQMEASSNDTHIWGLKLEFETKVDHFFIGSSNGTGTPGLFLAKSDGTASYDPEYCLSYKENGISYTVEDGSISPTIMHLVGSKDVEDRMDASMYQDAIAQGHDRKYDTFFTYTIPLTALGINKATLTSNGVGIMAFGTRGESCLDCVPHDPSMLDNVMLPYRANDNTSYEKEDLDTITVPLAAVGNAKGNGDITTPDNTPKPSTPTPVVKETPKANETPKASETPSPDKTPSADETPSVDVTGTPSADASATMIVNFGADKSSPQLAGKALELKAVGYNQTGKAVYEFAVDNEVVQAASESNTYAWTPAAGLHTIQVTMKDEAGKTVVVKKAYSVESDGTVVETATPEPVATAEVTNVPEATDGAEVTNAPEATNTAEVTNAPEATNGAEVTNAPAATTTAAAVTEVPAPATAAAVTTGPATTEVPTGSAVVTASPVVTATPTQTPAALKVTLTTKKASPQTVKTSIGLVAKASGGTGSYKYTFTAKLSNVTKTLAKNKAKNTVTWKPTKKGTYKITVKVTDGSGKSVTKSLKYKVTPKLAITTAKVNKKSIKVKTKIKITAKGTASKGTLKFKYVVKKSGAKKATTIKKYSTKKTVTWTPKKAGKYTITVYAKDGSKKTVKKNIKVTVKK